MSVGFSNEFQAFDSQAVIKVCGIGGGGGNAVGRMIEAGMKEVEFITINTDAQALKHSPAGTRLQIGGQGLGAGAKPSVGEAAALEDRDRIAEVLKGADMIFVTAGLGGGTGTGATPIVAEVAKESGALTVGVVTLPFQFEGGERMENAIHGLEKLQKHVDAAVVVPNDKLSILCQSNISFLNAFRLADEVLHNGVRAISELITVPGLINLDFADVRTILQDSGRALMGIGTGNGENRAVRAAEEAIVCPLLENSTIDGATRVIVNIQGGADISMREVHDAVSSVQKATQRGANIIFGAVVDDQEWEEIKVTVIAAGFPDQDLASLRPFTEMAEEASALEARLAAVGSDLRQSVSPSPLQPQPKRPEAPLEIPAVVSDDGPLSDEPVQIMFPEEDADLVDPFEADAHNEEEDEQDFDIPAFMRRRMKRK